MVLQKEIRHSDVMMTKRKKMLVARSEASCGSGACVGNEVWSSSADRSGDDYGADSESESRICDLHHRRLLWVRGEEGEGR